MYKEESPVSPMEENKIRIFFHRIFDLKFNLGCGHLRMDLCSICLELTAEIQVERDPVKNLTL
jgi:hypothetical protein